MQALVDPAYLSSVWHQQRWLNYQELESSEDGHLHVWQGLLPASWDLAEAIRQHTYT